MYRPCFEFVGFGDMPVDAQANVLAAMLQALVLADAEYLRAHPSTPPLYKSGVKYLREQPGTDNWQDIPRTLELKTGDCEDLASWRTAELNAAGEAAHVELIHFVEEGVTLFHVVVRRADGTKEDPSNLLGMPL